MNKNHALAIGGTIAAIIGGILAVEGGYANHPNDPGGETNYGITKAVAVQHGYTDPMKFLPVPLAQEIYFQDYIKRPGYLPIIEMSPAVGEKLVDAGVNTGTYRSSLWFQRALNSLNRGGKDYPTITVDGKVGPGTSAAYASLAQLRGRVRACELVIKLIDAQQATHYVSLTKQSMFTPGWVDHRIGNIPLSKCTDQFIRPSP